MYLGSFKVVDAAGATDALRKYRLSRERPTKKKYLQVTANCKPLLGCFDSRELYRNTAASPGIDLYMYICALVQIK